MTVDAIADVVVTASPRPRVVVPASSAPEVSCILVTFGTGPIVIDAVASLTDTLQADGIEHELVVVDNEHPWAGERTRRLLRLATSGVRLVVPGRNLGFAGGNNLGVELACGDVLALINPDVIARPGWLAPLRAALAEASIAGPVLYNADGTVQEVGHLLANDASTYPITDAIGPDEVVRPTYSSAACWVIERAEFVRLGGFDTAFHPAYYEDVDFALRAERDGRGSVVVGASGVVHERGGSTTSAAAPDLTVQRELFRRRWRAHLTSCPPFPG